MAVRNTESRIPQGFTPSDLGQATTSVGEKFVLVSYLSNPIVVDSLNNYVVFVTDEVVAKDCKEYKWVVQEDTGGGFREIQTKTTDEGLFSFKTKNAGNITVNVTVLDTAGDNIQTLVLHHAVQSRNQELEKLLDKESVFAALGGHPTTSRELVNDLSHYVVEALYDPYDGKFLEIPDLLLAAIVYKEALWRPKEYEFWRDYLTYELRRDIELSLAADELNNAALNSIRVQIDNTLGVCQIQPQTIAMALNRPGLEETYTPWLEKPKEKNKRPAIENEKLANFKALSLFDKIDIYNLLRFPKTNVRLCALLLNRLKNRPNRWPELGKENLLENENALKIIATEYNLGAVVSKKREARPSDYGKKIFSLMNTPFLLLIRSSGRLRDPFKSYLGKEFNIDDSNAVVRNDDLTPKKYQTGDDIPEGKNVGDTVTIPDGSTIYINEISNNFNYVFVEAYGWTATANLKESLFNETMGISRASYDSTEAHHKTVGDAKSLIREEIFKYPEIQPREIIPQGMFVEIQRTSEDSAGKKFVEVMVCDSVLGWTSQANLADEDVAPGLYEVIDPDARIRTETKEYSSTGKKLDQGVYLIIKEESTDTTSVGEYVKVSYTKADAGGGYIENTDKESVWTSVSNLVKGWANFKSQNAVWESGNYIGQIDIVSVVGRKSGTQPEVDKVSGSTLAAYQKLVDAAADDGLKIILTSGFRTFSEQQALWEANPNPNEVAKPGHSNHQNGVAFDLKTDNFNSSVYNWLKANGPNYGFLRTVDNEHWHWEYRPREAEEHGYKLPSVNP